MSLRCAPCLGMVDAGRLHGFYECLEQPTVWWMREGPTRLACITECRCGNQAVLPPLPPLLRLLKLHLWMYAACCADTSAWVASVPHLALRTECHSRQ